jgi:16S rRNA processing protein RimM
MPNYLDVGEIVNTHGIKGEVRIKSLTDHPEERYAAGSELVIALGNDEYEPVTVKSHRVHKSFDLLTFEGYTNINDVEQFKTKMLQVDEALLPELEAGEYYTSQIIGAEVYDEAENLIGELKEIMFLPANDVWVIARPNKSDLLLPHIDSVILDVALADKKITVRVLEGLDDDDAD